MSIMLEKYRTRYQELLNYFKGIRLAAIRSPSGWHQYDEQFRLRMAANPNASWGVVNQESWLFYVNSSTTKPQVDTFKHKTTSSEFYCANK
jgi:hypothetical protein